MGRPSNQNLTIRQALFVGYYTSGLSQAEAARRAGCSEKSAGRILALPKVKQAVGEAQKALQEKFEWSAAKAVARCDDLEKFAKDKNNAMAAAKIHELRCKLLGYLVDRHEVMGFVDLRAALTPHQARRMGLDAPPCNPFSD